MTLKKKYFYYYTYKNWTIVSEMARQNVGRFEASGEARNTHLNRTSTYEQVYKSFYGFSTCYDHKRKLKYPRDISCTACDLKRIKRVENENRKQKSYLALNGRVTGGSRYFF